MSCLNLTHKMRHMYPHTCIFYDLDTGIEEPYMLKQKCTSLISHVINLMFTHHWKVVSQSQCEPDCLDPPPAHDSHCWRPVLGMNSPNKHRGRRCLLNFRTHKIKKYFKQFSSCTVQYLWFTHAHIVNKCICISSSTHILSTHLSHTQTVWLH